MSTLASHISLKKRFPVWEHHYPDMNFWSSWHMAMLDHSNPNPPPPVTLMAELYHPASPQKNPASTLLLTFEKRTLLGHLPNEVRLERSVPRTLLDACAPATAQELRGFWGDLNAHYARHGQAGELVSLNEAAQAIRQEMLRRGRNPASIPSFFPASVTDEFSYAALARAVLFLALIPGSPCQAELYCASNSQYVPYDALTLNFILPESFLQEHGLPGRREIRLGLQIAVSDQYPTPIGTAIIPVLNKNVSFGTLLAPDTITASRLRQAGRSANLYLQ